MANTYTQIHIQAVFAVKHRKCLIQKEWKDKLYGYITGIIQNYDHKVLAINGMPDHIHIFFGMRPTQSIAELMRIVKCDSTNWINDNLLTKQTFSWQGGYGAFAYNKSLVNIVIDYIKNQEEHHARKTFIKEYIEFLEKFEVDYDPDYIFKPVDYDVLIDG